MVRQTHFELFWVKRDVTGKPASLVDLFPSEKRCESDDSSAPGLFVGEIRGVGKSMKGFGRDARSVCRHWRTLDLDPDRQFPPICGTPYLFTHARVVRTEENLNKFLINLVV